MHRAVNAVGAAAVGIALLCVLPGGGQADPGLKFQNGPWIPALALVSSAPNPEELDGDARGDVASYAAFLAIAVEPEALGESGAALQGALAAAGSSPVAIPARVAIEPAPGAPEPTEAEWADAVLVIAQADGDAAEPAPTVRSGQRTEEQRDETRRWVPSLGFTNAFLVQPTQASSTSVFTPSGQPVRPAASGSLAMIDPTMSATLELMTPSPIDVAGRPRLFLHGDVGMNFGFARNIAKEGSPGEIALPPSAQNRPLDSDSVLQGQGSTTTAEPKTLQIGAGAGIAFTIDALGRRFRIKPSVEYFQETLEITGVVNRATILSSGRRPPPGAANDVPATLNPPTELRGNASQTYHGIGPGLEIEADTRRAGPLILTLFVSGQAYRILGDREVQFSATGDPVSAFNIQSGVPQTPSATWTFEKAAWSYQGLVGMRFRWLPED